MITGIGMAGIGSPAAAQWDSLLNSGVRILQQQRELEFRREQEERRRQEEERRRQDELRRQEQYRQPTYSPPEPRTSRSYEAPSAAFDPSVVAEIQRLLNAHGYDAGPVDGLMGSKTRDAIRDYQIDQGLRPSGEPTREVARRLRRGPVPMATPVESPLGGPSSSGPAAVAEIQRHLNQQGYDTGPVDGMVGAQTREAIRYYQSDRGLPVTGEPSLALLENLRHEPASPLRNIGPGSSGGNLYGATSSTAPAPLVAPALPGLTTLNGRVVLAGSRSPSDLKIDEAALRRMTARLVASSLPELNSQAGIQLLDLMQLLSASERRSIYLDALENRDRPVPSSVWGEGNLFEQLENQDWYAPSESLPRLGVTPFEQERLVEVFRKQGLQKVIAQAPKLPIPMVILCELSLAEYDRQRQMFDLGREISSCGVRQVQSLVRYVTLSAPLNTKGIRPQFEISPQEAERLFLSLPAKYTGDTRVVVLAIEAALQELVPDISSGRQTALLQLQASGAALYADSSLEREIHRFSSSARPDGLAIQAPADPAALANARSLAELQEKPLLAGRVLLSRNAHELREDTVDLTTPAVWHLVHEAPDLARGRDFELLDLLDERARSSFLRAAVLESVDPRHQKAALKFLAENAWSYSRSRSLLSHYGFTEFDEARLRQHFETQVLPTAIESNRLQTPLAVFFVCSLALGEYQLDRQGFAFRYAPSSCSEMQMNSPGGNIRFSGRFDLSAIPENLPMPMDEAERFVETIEASGSPGHRRDRQVLLGVEATITGIAASKDQRSGQMDAQLTFQVTGAGFYRDSKSWTLIQRIDLTTQVPDAVAQVPESLPLNDGDTLTLLLLRDGHLNPDEALWRTMMQVQSNRQRNNRDLPPWSRYPKELAGENTTGEFADWMRKRALSLPDVMTVKAQHQIEPSLMRQDTLRVLEEGTPLSQQVRGVAGALGIRPDFLYAQSVSSNSWAPDSARTFVVALPAPKSAYSVSLPSQAAAKGGSFTMELTLRLGATQIVQLDRGRDVLVVEAAPEHATVVVDGSEAEETFDTAALVQESPPRSVGRIPFPDTEWLRLQQARLKGEHTEEGMREALARTSFGRSLDEFALREQAAALLQRASSAAPRPETAEIWTIGRLRLDTYDFNFKRFPISSLSLSAMPVPSTELAEQLAKQITFEVSNANDLGVDKPPEEAKQWMDANADHPSYPVRVRGRILGAGSSGALRLEVLEMDLLTSDAIVTLDDPHSVTHEVVLGPYRPAAATAPAPPSSDGATVVGAAQGTAVHVEPGALDIVDLRLGEPFEEAIAKAEASIEAPIRVDVELAELEGKPAPDWSAFRTATSIRSRDGSQVISVHRAPPIVAWQVTGISRVVTFGPDRLFPFASVKELLTGKYGEPQEAHGKYMVWMPRLAVGEASTAEAKACAGAMNGRTMRILISTPLNATSEDPLRLAHTIFGNLSDIASTPECGEMLVAVLDTDRDGRVRQLITVLGAPDTNARIEGAGRAAETSANEHAIPKIKL